MDHDRPYPQRGHGSNFGIVLVADFSYAPNVAEIALNEKEKELIQVADFIHSPNF